MSSKAAIHVQLNLKTIMTLLFQWKKL